MNNNNIEQWSAEGMDQTLGQQFAQDIHRIDALQLFVRALPKWCRQHGTGVKITIECNEEWGWENVGVQLSFDRKSLPVAAANGLVEQLMDHSKVMELEGQIEAMRGLGVDPAVVNILVDQANELARKLRQ